MKRDFQIKFLINSGLKPQDYFLDLGCGTLRGGIPIIAYLQEGHYFGVESRKGVLNEGQKEVLESGLEQKNPVLLVSPDISALIIDQKFDFIWAFSVLIHMSDDILIDALNFVYRHLSDEGIFYANVNIAPRQEGNWQGFPVVWRTFEFYSETCYKSGLAVSDLGSLKDLGHVSKVQSQDSQRMLRISKI